MKEKTKVILDAFQPQYHNGFCPIIKNTCKKEKCMWYHNEMCDISVYFLKQAMK